MEPAFTLADILDLPTLAAKYSHEYRTADPYPSVVIDNLLPDGIIRKVLEEFPTPDAWPETWGKRNDIYQKKLGSRGRDLIGPWTNRLIDELNGEAFLAFLSAMTGIPGLVADHELIGAGLHQIQRDGYLAIHADFNKAHHRDRRLNLLLYLNEGWQEEWGGHFEMWNADLTRKVRSISPTCNRIVVFNTDETSYHGHPNPLRCPPDRSRKSLALYYYTRGVRNDKVSDKFKTEYVDTDWKFPQRKVKLI